MADETASVLDASALLALLNLEPGAAAVWERVGSSVISSVNWCEAFGKLRAVGVDGEPLRIQMAQTGIAVIAFDSDDAEAAGELLPRTRAHGLSLADRACLALAARFGLPAVTADHTWTTLDLGVEVVCIR